jgi:FkbM family methyltransferase
MTAIAPAGESGHSLPDRAIRRLGASMRRPLRGPLRHVLEQTIALNDLNPRVTVIRAAAGARDGELEFISGWGGRSHGARPGQAATTRVPMIDALPPLADCDLLTMDIEGGEWPILTDPRLADTALRAICLEYHLWNCPGTDPTATAQALLNDAGFHIVALREEGHGGVIWATQ